MHPPLHDVVAFEPIGSYTLRVRFEDDSEQSINFEPILYGPIFGPLRDPKVFRKVRLDPEARTLVWPNGADFDPATLYNWPDNEAHFVEKVRFWHTTKASVS